MQPKINTRVAQDALKGLKTILICQFYSSALQFKFETSKAKPVLYAGL